MVKKIYVVGKVLLDDNTENTLIVKYEENGKTKKIYVEGKAIEIIEVLCQALKKPFPENYKFENQF